MTACTGGNSHAPPRSEGLDLEELAAHRSAMTLDDCYAARDRPSARLEARAATCQRLVERELERGA